MKKKTKKISAKDKECIKILEHFGKEITDVAISLYKDGMIAETPLKQFCLTISLILKEEEDTIEEDKEEAPSSFIV